jgi:hypothetical protein
MNYLGKAVVKGNSKESSSDGAVDIPFRLRSILCQLLCRWTRSGLEPDLQRRCASCVCEDNIHGRTQRHEYCKNCYGQAPQRFPPHHIHMLVQYHILDLTLQYKCRSSARSR